MMSSCEWNFSSAVSCGWDREWKEVEEQEDTLLSLSFLLMADLLPCESAVNHRPGIKSAGAQNARCTHQICQQPGRKHLRSPKPQPVAIKVLLRCGERPEATWRSVKNPITSLSYIVSKSNSWKQNRSDSPLHCLQWPERGDCGCYHMNKNFQLGKWNFFFIIAGTN